MQKKEGLKLAWKQNKKNLGGGFAGKRVDLAEKGGFGGKNYGLLGSHITKGTCQPNSRYFAPRCSARHYMAATYWSTGHAVILLQSWELP